MSPGLTDQARRLLRTVLPCSVRLVRLTEKAISEACRPAPVHTAWRPPASVQGLLWRPAQPPARPGPWRAPDRAARSATSTLTAAAAVAAAAAADSRAMSGNAAAARAFRPLGSGQPAAAGDSRTRPVAGTFSLPPGLSITRQRFTPKPRAPGTAATLDRGSVWRPTLVGAGGTVIRPTLVRGRGLRFPTPRGRAQSGGLKTLPAPAPSKPSIGRELRDKGPLVIDLCSSSDEEGDPPPDALPPRPPRPRIKTEVPASPAAASTKGPGWQSKNAHSHWSQSCGGLANGVRGFASLVTGQDSGLPNGHGQPVATEYRPTAAVTLDFIVTSACTDPKCGTTSADGCHLVDVAGGDTCCVIWLVLTSSLIFCLA